MPPDEIEIMDDLIEKLKPKKCLEWGSGFSTVYFPQKHPCIEGWVSVEHNGKWFNKILPLTDKDRVLMVLNTPDNYTDVGTGFDFILIDGIKRNWCLEKARYILNPGGKIVLHDASRHDYWEGIELYGQNKVFLSQGEFFPDHDARNGLMMLWV